MNNSKILTKSPDGKFVPEANVPAIISWKEHYTLTKTSRKKFRILCDNCGTQVNVPDKKNIPLIQNALCSKCYETKLLVARKTKGV